MTNSVQLSTPEAKAPSTSAASYGQILKSSSIVGGAQAITLAIGMVRTKLVAVLLGPSGVGLIGLLQSATSMVGTVAGLGIAQSAVRQIAESCGTNDQLRIARTIRVLRRICWVTGILGWVLTAALAYPLSLWTFGHAGRVSAIAVLGATLLLGSIASGQSALLQGVRRIGDLARLQILSGIASTVLSIGLYAWLRERGIIPVLLATAALNLCFSWCLARRVRVAPVELSWTATAREGLRFVSLGLVFIWSGALTTGVTLATQSLISRQFGVEANGIFQAAYSISGAFAGFILNAMGTDFYPRLTAVARDNDQVNRLVNEQTEVGVLLALPGVIATLIFSPWVISLFYTSKFLPASDLLPLFVLGVCGRVISWPLGYMLLAKGASQTFAATETVFTLLHILLIWLGLRFLGLNGVATAFALMYACYTMAMLWVAACLTGFRWSSGVSRLVASMACMVMVAYAARAVLNQTLSVILGVVLIFAGTVYSIRQLAGRLGPQHRIVRTVSSLPILRRLVGN